MTGDGWLKNVVLRLARVPSEPQVPDGDKDTIRVFNAGRNYFVWRIIVWGVGNVVVALGLVGIFAFTFIPKLPPICSRDLVGWRRRCWHDLRSVDSPHVFPAAVEL